MSTLIRRPQWTTMAAVVAALTTSAAWADDAAEQMSPSDIKAAIAAASKSGGSDDDEGSRFPKFEDVVKDLEAHEGFFTLYKPKDGDKKQDPEKLLARIPRSLLDQDMLFATSITSGGPLTGFMWSDYLIRWKVVGKYVKIITPDVRYVTKDDEPISDVIERTYNPGYLAAVRIETMTPSGDIVIDLGDLLKSDLVNVAFFGGVQSQLSSWAKIKTFPQNVLVEVDLAVGGRSGGSTVGVAYAFQKLPNERAYTPRKADPRVGYFLTVRRDWTKPANEVETVDRFINRWKLEKQDPSLELSPPKEPIVFIIEKTVPIKWRRWVREGIEEWNKAFEEIGFDRAIVVHQQTDDNEWADKDPEDARYNFFRWIVSGRAFAMGPSRTDPRTGQILDADIIFDDLMVRGWLEDFDIYAPSTALSFDPGLTAWMQAQPEVVPEPLRAALAQMGEDKTDQWVEHWRQQRGHRCGADCSFAAGMRQQVAMGQFAMMATGRSGKEIPERLIGEVIKHITAHEVGHTIGLRHNFKASSWLTMDEIRERRNQSDQPTTASVMDYNPLVFFADDDLDEVKHFTSPVLGPYDKWAVAYGYSEAGRGESAEKMLAELLARCNEPGLAYGTDEDTMSFMSPDPLTNRWDHSATPIAWAKSRVALGDKLLSDIKDWAIKEGESYDKLTRAYVMLNWERASYFRYVARLVSGQYFNRNVKGDPNGAAPLTLVDPDEQRAAVATLASTLFNDKFYNTDSELLNYLPAERWWDWTGMASPRIDFPIHDRIEWLQMFGLLNLTAPPVLQRMYDAELKSDSDNKFTVAEYLQKLNRAIFAELYDGKLGGSCSDVEPCISSIDRTMQRLYVNMMLQQASTRPAQLTSADVQSMVRYSLKDLGERIEKTLDAGGLDFATRAHLFETHSRIERTLDAEFAAR